MLSLRPTDEKDIATSEVSDRREPVSSNLSFIHVLTCYGLVQDESERILPNNTDVDLRIRVRECFGRPGYKLGKIQ
jgi:hypothetical protein